MYKRQPGDSIVIDFMVRVRTTDPSSPLAQGNNKVINAYATDNVGNPKWVDWKRSDDDEMCIRDRPIREWKQMQRTARSMMKAIAAVM